MPGGWGKRLGFSSIAITAAQKEPPAGREPRRAVPEVTDFGLRASCVSELAARDDLAKVELRAERDALEPHAHLGLAEPVKDFGVLRTDDFAVMFAGHEESGGDTEIINGKKMRGFYGMSSKNAMDKYSGGVAKYRAAEGKFVWIEDRGPVEQTCQDILGGVRSACTYVGAKRLKELTMRTTFVRVSQQLNEVFGKS